jgi:hypothetical protein
MVIRIEDLLERRGSGPPRARADHTSVTVPDNGIAAADGGNFLSSSQ